MTQKEQNAKCIKMIGRKNFVLGLYQMHSGIYYVTVEKDENKHMSQPTKDFNVANFIFDCYLKELEGH